MSWQPHFGGPGMGTGTSPGHGQGHGPHSQFVNTQGHYPNIATPTSAPSYPYSSSTYTTMSSGCPGFASNHQIATSQPCQVSQSHPPVSLPMQPSTQTAYAYPYMLQHQQVGSGPIQMATFHNASIPPTMLPNGTMPPTSSLVFGQCQSGVQHLGWACGSPYIQANIHSPPQHPFVLSAPTIYQGHHPSSQQSNPVVPVPFNTMQPSAVVAVPVVPPHPYQSIIPTSFQNWPTSAANHASAQVHCSQGVIPNQRQQGPPTVSVTTADQSAVSSLQSSQSSSINRDQYLNATSADDWRYVDGTCNVRVDDTRKKIEWTGHRISGGNRTREGVATSYYICLGSVECPNCEYTIRPRLDPNTRGTIRAEGMLSDVKTCPVCQSNLQLVKCGVRWCVKTVPDDRGYFVNHQGTHNHRKPPPTHLAPQTVQVIRDAVISNPTVTPSSLQLGIGESASLITNDIAAANIDRVRHQVHLQR